MNQPDPTLPLTPETDGEHETPVTSENPLVVKDMEVWGDVIEAFGDDEDEDDDELAVSPSESADDKTPSGPPYTHEPYITAFHDIVAWSENRDVKTRPNFIAVINDMSVHDLYSVVRAGQVFIRSWRLSGEPRKKRSYDLDVMVLWDLYQELRWHFDTVYPDIPPEGGDIFKVEMQFRDEFPGLEFPGMLKDVHRMRSDSIETLMPVIIPSVTSWNLPGDWRDVKYVLSLPAPILKQVFQGVNAFWYDRLFRRPKSSGTKLSSG